MLDRFRSAVASAGDRPFLRYFDSVPTFGDVDRPSDAFAVTLADKGFGLGDRLPPDRVATPEGAENFCSLVNESDGHVPEPVSVDADEVAVAVITHISGATGAPKGAKHPSQCRNRRLGLPRVVRPRPRRRCVTVGAAFLQAFQRNSSELSPNT
ncbi:hypothetical protein GGC64_006043 [Mycobacterium sp. OAS707]|uniref:hypothetical protein n=1 Tax=Mycobacterium sp. OAS707 TaxID=2663822 RepID=UPI001789AA63|nr:hypothetical protein [Mycobacterium sp. OAS707]MBE1551956.1 hypothetical protein [Mycobacterium sp. OAS707]